MRSVLHFFKQLLVTVLLIGLIGLVVFGVYFGWQGHKLYEEAVKNYPISMMYESIQSRTDFVSYEEMPQTYINAVISVEDRRFVSHHGIDPISIGRALLTDLKTHSLAEGGSTLTQQLAKNELFTQEKRLARKAAEMFAALSIEKQYDKRQIFEMYANTIYFGNNYYGIAQAAQGYFGKTPAELTDAEAVLLAGLPNAPSLYSPTTNPDLALKRALVVLQRMTEAKVLTKEQAAELGNEVAALSILTN